MRCLKWWSIVRRAKKGKGGESGFRLESPRVLLSARRAGSDDGATEKGKNTVLFLWGNKYRIKPFSGSSMIQAYNNPQQLEWSAGWCGRSLYLLGSHRGNRTRVVTLVDSQSSPASLRFSSRGSFQQWPPRPVICRDLDRFMSPSRPEKNHPHRYCICCETASWFSVGQRTVQTTPYRHSTGRA